MPYANFVHLHNRSEYSLLQSALRVRDLVRLASENNMSAVALTDRMNLHACINFYNECYSHGIKPIIGAEILMSPVADIISVDPLNPVLYEIVILCEDIKGYENLCELLTRINLDETSNHKFARKEWIEELAGNWIILSGGVSGEIFQSILNKDENQARQVAEWFSHKSGPGKFYIELGWHGLDSEKITLPKLIELSKQLNIPVVATNQNAYVEKADSYAVELLKRVDHGTTVETLKELMPESDEFYFRSVAEMELVFKNIPEAIKNTVAISDKCAVELPINKGLLTPHFEAPDKKNNLKYLEELCAEGLRKHYPELENETKESLKILPAKKRKEIKNRLKFELETISKMGFISYFLIVADFVNHAKNSGIPVGPGRGSAAGSIVSFLLGITDIDPLKYGLLFERFLNPARKKMPDIDIDFCQRLRGNVIKYVRDKYGKENVSQIATFNTFKYKAALRAVGRVLSVPTKKIDRFCAMIIDFERNHKHNKTKLIRQAIEKHDQIRELYHQSRDDKQILEFAARIEGLPRNISTHAAGVVISPFPLRKLVPLNKGGESEVLTEYDMYSIDKFGFLKMDFLGLTTLTIIDDTLRKIAENKEQRLEVRKTEDGGQRTEDGGRWMAENSQISNFKFQISNLNEIPLDDKSVYELMQSGDLLGIFQLETSAGMKRLVQELQPTEFNDIIALISLYRPGAMHGSQSYIARKTGREKVAYIHPKLEPILKETYGILVYQEQVMQILNKLVGYTLSEADFFRQIMSKKLKEKMAKEKNRFLKRALKNKLDEEIANELFERIEKFAGYGFNKSHATAYAFVAYQTAWLKVNYTAEFYTALLNHTSKIEEIYQSSKKLGIKFLPPDVNKSEKSFSVETEKENKKKAIRFGLEDIKNVGPAAAEDIIRERKENGNFLNIDDFCRRINHRIVNRTAAESLVKSGSCDVFDSPRKQMCLIVEDTASTWAKNSESTLQKSFFESFDEDEKVENKTTTISKPPEDWEVLERLSYEKEMLGIYVTGHPLDNYSAIWHLLVNTNSKNTGYLSEDASDDNLSMLEVTPETKIMGGLLLKSDWKISKRKTAYGVLTFEDFFGTFEVLVWSDKVEEYKKELKPGEIYFIKGVLKESFRKTSLSASAILSVESAISNWITKLKINFIEDENLSEKLKFLSEIIKSNKGETAVELNIQTSGGISKITLPKESRLMITEKCLDEIIKKCSNQLSNIGIT